MIFSRQMTVFALAAVLLLTGSLSVTAQDQAEADALVQAHARLKESLDRVDDLFYKEMKTDAGLTFYNLIWDKDGETSKITFELRQLGHYGGEPIFGVLAYTTVAQAEGALPPAVIKAVATKNETTGLGYFSMTDSFNTVYMNFSAPSDTLTPGQIWMTCAYVHNNRIKMKKEIDSLLSASGR